MNLRTNIFNELWAHTKKKQCTVLIGARQIGKTTLLKQLADKLIHNDQIAVQLNLERKEILNDLNAKPENIFNYIPQVDEQVFVLIDEVQYLNDPSNFIKLLYDEYADKIKLIVTGSSAFYIDKNFKDSLAGRKKIFELYTLSFEEFLQFKNEDTLLKSLQQFKKAKLKKIIAAPRLWTLIEEYIIYGGYPEVVLATTVPEKIEVLEELKNSFLKKDILESGINEELKFYNTMQILASETGSLLNINSLGLTVKANNSTIEHAIWIMRKCFHIQLARPYFNNVRKELSKMPKVYFNDTGLRNCLINYYAPLAQRLDKGALFENFIFTLLRNQFQQDEIKYWRTADGNEVDFVIDRVADAKAYEIKFSNTENKLNKYKKFTSSYPDVAFSFINWGDEALWHML
jgi:uncharacterized protein